MTSVETTIITTALPNIVSSLHGISIQSWIVAAYLMTTALSTPVYGKLADRIGRKPVYITGLVLFTSGSLLCGLSTNIAMLVGFRALQGLGAGAIMPITFTVIADLYSYAHRANVMALNNTAWGISALIGPLVGGYLVTNLSWHWVFFINVPLGIVVLAIISLMYREHRTQAATFTLDIKGTISLSLFLFTLLGLLQQIGARVIQWPMVWGMAAVSVSLLLAFIVIERRASDPVMPIKLFKNATFTVQIMTALLLSAVQIGFQVYFPMWLQAVYRASAALAGLAVTPSPVMWLITSFFVGSLIKRFSPKRIAIPIIIVQIIFYIPLIWANERFPELLFYLVSGVTGASLGVVITMNTIISQQVVPKTAIGTASSMLTLGRTLGQTIATGVFGMMFNRALDHGVMNTGISSNTINDYLAASGKQIGANSTVLNTIVLAGMHLIFATVVIILIAALWLNVGDRNNHIIE